MALSNIGKSGRSSSTNNIDSSLGTKKARNTPLNNTLGQSPVDSGFTAHTSALAAPVDNSGFQSAGGDGFQSSFSIEGSDDADILGLGLNLKRDISSFMGIEGAENIQKALGDVNKLLETGMRQIGLSSDQALQALQNGTLTASDILGAGLQQSQGFISEGQLSALDQVNQGFGQAQQALGQGRQDLAGGFGQAAQGLGAFGQAGQQALGQFQQGSTAQGFGQNLQNLQQSGALNPLIEARTRAAQSAQGAAGLSRSGAGLNQITDIPQDVLLGIEGMLSGRQQQLAGQGLQAQGQIAGFQAGGGQALAGQQGNIANLLAQQGQLGAGIQGQGFQNMANLSQQAAQKQAGLFSGLGQDASNVFVGAGQDIASLLGAQAQANLEASVGSAEARAQGMGNLGDFGGSLMSAFSDLRLKKNIVKIDELNGVNIYSFEANDLGDKIGMNMTIGVIADELELIHPDLVGERDGFKTVNYNELWKRVG